jgi:hypothetical protein
MKEFVKKIGKLFKQWYRNMNKLISNYLIYWDSKFLVKNIFSVCVKQAWNAN